MSKTDSFFRAMAWLCLGVIIGFLIAPIKRGITCTICSYNNVGAEEYDFLGEEEDMDEPDEE